MHGSRSKIPSKISRPYIYDVKFLALLGTPYIYNTSRLRVKIYVRSGYMFRPFKRSSSGHPLNENSIKSKTYEMLVHYVIPGGFKAAWDHIVYCASISYVLDLIEFSFNGWPEDDLLKGRNM
jgi:hypothetical protein